MSGELISTNRGKIPQRAIRHIDELPYAVTYEVEENQILLGVDFGGSDYPFIIATPASRRAKCIEVQIAEVTETFAAVTTDASVEIGDGSDQDGFAFTDDIADGTASQIFTSYDGSISPGALGEIIQPGDQVTITAVAGTGTPTGIARVFCTFLYFQ